MRDNRSGLWHYVRVAEVIDTHGLIKDLVRAGLSEKQAEAIAGGFKKVAGPDGLVTKHVLQAELAQLEARMSNRMAAYLSLAVAVLGLFMTMIKVF